MTDQTKNKITLRLESLGVYPDGESGAWKIPLDLVDASPFQPRVDLGDVARLRESMDQNGQAVPVEVRIVGERFQLLHGHRRTAAARLQGETKLRIDEGTDFVARSWDVFSNDDETKHNDQASLFDDVDFGSPWTTIRALVNQVEDDQAARIVIGENQERKDLTPLEVARAAKQFAEQGIAQAEIQTILGRSQPAISNALRAIDVLPGEILDLVESNLLTLNATRPLLPIDPRQAADETQRFILETEIRNIVDNALPKTILISEHARRPQVIGEPAIRSALVARLSGKRTGSPEPKLVWRPLNDDAGKVFRDSMEARKVMKLPTWEVLGAGIPKSLTRNFGSGLGLWTFQNRKWDGNRTKWLKGDQAAVPGEKKSSAASGTKTKNAEKMSAAHSRGESLKMKFGAPVPVFDVTGQEGYSSTTLSNLPDDLGTALRRIPGFDRLSPVLSVIIDGRPIIDWKSVRGAVQNEQGFEDAARRGVATAKKDQDTTKAIDVVTDMAWLTSEVEKKADKLETTGSNRRVEALAVAGQAAEFFRPGRAAAISILAALAVAGSDVPISVDEGERLKQTEQRTTELPTIHAAALIAERLDVFQVAVSFPNGPFRGPVVDWTVIEANLDRLTDRSVETLAWEIMVGGATSPKFGQWFEERHANQVLRIASPVLLGSDTTPDSQETDEEPTERPPETIEAVERRTLHWAALPGEWFLDDSDFDGPDSVLSDLAPKTMDRWTGRGWIIPIRFLGETPADRVLCQVTVDLDKLPKYVGNAEVDELDFS